MIFAVDVLKIWLAFVILNTRPSSEACNHRCDGQIFREIIILRASSATPTLYSNRKICLASDSRTFVLNLHGGEPTNNPRIDQKRGNSWVQNQSTQGFYEGFETCKPKKQRIKSFTQTDKNEGGAETSIPNVGTNESEDSVRTNESESDGTRSLLPFDGGFESRSNSMLLGISHLNAAYVANFFFLAVATCHMAVVVHAIMPEHLLLEFNARWNSEGCYGAQECVVLLNLVALLANVISSAGLCCGYLRSEVTARPIPLCRRDYFPYGSTSFIEIRTEKKYWVDNSRHIATTVEITDKHVMLLRPPRWGKSLFLNMLDCYLDINAEKSFDVLFHGTDIYAMKNQLRCRNRYYVMRFDFSIAVEGGDPAVIEHRMNRQIQQAVNYFRRRYKLNYDDHIEDSALNNVVNAVHYVEQVLEGEVFVLIDEYDRFANKIMFENPDMSNKIVAGRSGDPFSSPIRSFFETLKMLTNIRSFTVGISPIALADSSGANFIVDISACAGDVVGLTEADIHSALTSIFGEDFKERISLMSLIKRFFDGFYFATDNDPPLTPHLYHTQLCLHFFRKLCNPVFREKALSGTLSVSEMTDSNTKISDNVINLLCRQSVFAGLISELYSSGSVNATRVPSFKLREILSESSSPDLLVAFMFWHGLLTLSPDGSYSIPNQVVGDAGGILHSVVKAMGQLTHDVRSVINEPSADKVWQMNNDVWSKMNTIFDNAISEGALVGFAEVRLQNQGSRENFEVICEKRTLGRKRCDLVLIEHVFKSILILEYKWLRPGGGAYEQDLALLGKPACLVTVSTVEEANEQLLKFEIVKSKRIWHGGAATVRDLLAKAQEQVSAYKRELCSRPEYAGYRCNTAVVIHATTKTGAGRCEDFRSVVGAWVQGPDVTAPCRAAAEDSEQTSEHTGD